MPGLKLNLTDPNPPVQIFLVKGSEDPDKDPYLMLRPATAKVLKKIREKTHTRRFKNVRGVVHEYFDVDDDQYDLMLWKYCMPGWGNLPDENGNIIEYSPKNALFLLDESPFFSNLVNEKLDEIKEIIADRALGREKNS